MSPRSDRLMTTGGDTSGEGVRTMIWVQVQTVSWRQTDTPQEKVWGPWYKSKIRPSHDDKKRHLRQKVWGPWYESKFRPFYDDRRRHLRKRCEDHNMSPSSNRLMTTDGDTLGECVTTMIWVQDHTVSWRQAKTHQTEGVRTMIWVQVQTVLWQQTETPQEKVWGLWYESKFRQSHDNR